MNNEVRNILLALKSSLMKPHVMMMLMVTMRRESKLRKIDACLCWPSIDVREEFDDKNSLAQPFDAKKCKDVVEKNVGKSSHLLESPTYLACTHMPNANKFGHSQASNPCSVSTSTKVKQFRRYLVAKMLPLPTTMMNWMLGMLSVSNH